MAFTDNCDIFGAVHEDGFNRIASHIGAQRPSLFNYGTQRFVARPEDLCKPVHPHPEVVKRGNPLITLESPLPIPGTDGALGLEFCIQLTELRIDFHPGNQFPLPGELSPPLATQHLALHVQVCGAIVCPDHDVVTKLGDAIADRPLSVARDKERDEPRHQDRPRLPIQPIQSGKPLCFCLDVFAVAHAEIVSSAGRRVLAIRLDGLEIVDIRPEELESIIECFVATTLRLGILPRIRIALDTLVYELGQYATLSITPAPISAAVPNNPAIENDQIKVFVNVGVS